MKNSNLTTNNSTSNTSTEDSSPKFIQSMRNTSLPVYVTDEQGNVIEPKEIEMIPVDKPYVDKHGKYITEEKNYNGGYSDNLEIRFNTTDKAAIDAFFNVDSIDNQVDSSLLSREMATNLAKFHGKVQLSDSECAYKRASMVECENTIDDVKVKGFKLIFKPEDKFQTVDYSGINSYADMLASLTKA